MKYVSRFLLVLFFAYGNFNPLFAQWIQVGVLGGGGPQIKALAAGGRNVFVGTDSGIFVSSNNGASWTEANSGLTSTNVPSLAANGSVIFAGTHDGVFSSSNDGTSWNPVNSGPIQNTDAASLVFKGSDLFAGTFGNGVFLSTDSGATWRQLNSGLTDIYVFCLAVSGGNVLAGTEAGVFLSTDNGASWNGLLQGPWGYNVRAFAVLGSNVYAGVDANDGSNSIYRSTDNGASWTILGGSPSNTTTYCFAVSGTDVFAGGDGGLHLSTDNGTTWQQASTTEFPETVVSSLVVSDTNLFAGTALFPPIGVFRRPLAQMITGVEERGIATAAAFSLSQNYPNPFNPSTVITYQLPVDSHMTLKVYDVLGREVRTLVNERQHAGQHSVTFDAAGLPSGVYLYRLSAGSYNAARKLMFVK